MQLIDLNRSYTYADYLTWKFEERVELIKGKLFKMSPAPNTTHQIISGFIFNKLYEHIDGNSCMVFSAPFDVRLPMKSKMDKDITTVVQPDICVICDINKIDEKGCIGAPDIVVEILSPANNKKELKNKYEIYEQSQVKEYWVVSPQDFTFLMYSFKDGVFVPSRLMVEGDLITSAILPGFTLNLTDLFGKIS